VSGGLGLKFQPLKEKDSRFPASLLIHSFYLIFLENFWLSPKLLHFVLVYSVFSNYSAAAAMR
jgi:hypothetical protein